MRGTLGLLALVAALLFASFEVADAHLTQVCSEKSPKTVGKTKLWLQTWHVKNEGGPKPYGFKYRIAIPDVNGAVTWTNSWKTRVFQNNARVEGKIPDKSTKVCTLVCATRPALSYQEVEIDEHFPPGALIEVKGTDENQLHFIMWDAMCTQQQDRLLQPVDANDQPLNPGQPPILEVGALDGICTANTCTQSGFPPTCCDGVFDLALVAPGPLGTPASPLAMGNTACVEWTAYYDFPNYSLTIRKDGFVAAPISIPFVSASKTGGVNPSKFQFCFIVPVDPLFGPGDKYIITLTPVGSLNGDDTIAADMRPTEYPEAGVVYDFVGTGQCLDGSSPKNLYSYYEGIVTKAVCENTCSLYRQTTTPPNPGCLGYSYHAGDNKCRLQVLQELNSPPVFPGSFSAAQFVEIPGAQGAITSWSTTDADAGYECRVKRNPGWAFDLIGYGQCIYQDSSQDAPLQYAVYDQTGMALLEVVQEDCAEACHADTSCVGFNFGVSDNVNQCQVLHQTTFPYGNTIIVDVISSSTSSTPTTPPFKCFRKRDCSKVLLGSVYNSVTRSCVCGAGTFHFGNRCIACTGPQYSLNANTGECTCAPFFTRRGDFCVDIDECAQELDICDVHATCTNVDAATLPSFVLANPSIQPPAGPAGYTCACGAGYAGDALAGSGTGCTSSFVAMSDIGACRDRNNVKLAVDDSLGPLSEPECARECSRVECQGYQFDSGAGTCELFVAESGKGPIVSAGVSAGESATMTCRRRSIGCGDGGVVFLSEQSTVDDVSGELVLRFEHAAFATDKPGNNMVIEFGQCKGTWTAASNTWTTVSGPSGSSWTASVSPGCPTVEFRADLNDALANCNFKYDDSDVTSTKLTTSIRIVTEEVSTTGVRATEFTTKNDNVVVAQIKLGTLSLVQSGQITVFGAVRPDVLVRSVTFDAGTEMMTVLYSTEVQYPYQLASDQSPAQYPSGSAGTPANWPQFPEWVTIDFAEDQQTQNCPAPAVDSNGVCTQNWKVVLQRPKRCAELLGQDLDGTFSFDFTVSCRASFLNTVPTQGPGACFPAPMVASMPQYQDVTLGFSTNSDDYCKRVIAELPLLGTIAIYDEPTYSNVQDTFVFGSTAYAKIELTAKAKIEHAHIEKVELRAQDCSIANDPLSCYFNGDSVVLYTNPHLASADFSKIDAHTLVPTGAAASAVALSKFARTNDVNAFNPTVSTFPSTTPGINSNNARVVFNFEWNSFTSPASVGQDASENTRVYAEVRVKFVDQSAGRRMLLQVGNGNIAMQTSAQATVRSKSAVNFGPVSAASAATPSFAALALTLLAFLRA